MAPDLQVGGIAERPVASGGSRPVVAPDLQVGGIAERTAASGGSRPVVAPDLQVGGIVERTVASGGSRPVVAPDLQVGGILARVRIGIVALTLLGVAACSTTPADPDARFAETLLSARAAKDAAFRNQPDRPVPAAKFAEFLPLHYYPPDPAWSVPASLKPAAVRTPLRVPTSTGKVRDMEVVGLLEFLLKGQKLSLAALVEAGTPPDRLFVPFTDLTSGQETYGGGRYLEIERSATGIYVVDFNRAFHPFCYYNADYDCPYPPPQNRLPVHVRAGERLAAPAAPLAR